MEFAAAIQKHVDALPDRLRAPTARWFERLTEAYSPLSMQEESLARLVRTVACSEFGASVLFRHWNELSAQLAAFSEQPSSDVLSRVADKLGQSSAPADEVKAALRRERNRRLLQILWRELSDVASVEETLEALSELADQLLRAATNYATQQMVTRFGILRDETGAAVPLVVLGMGKLGGRELNFSSDIDLIFTYSNDGESDGQKCLSAQEYFGRLARNVVALIDDVTEDGFVHRTDTRLRPFGASGPPVVSFAALESYLLQHGRDWERYAYIKASIVGPRPDSAVQNDLFDNIITPFVYRRYVDYGIFESLRDMHAMISAEVRRRDLADNIKLGSGGIREIEFIVQSVQLVRGGGRPELQSQSLQQVLPLLVDNRGLSEEGADALSNAYRFLRRLENFIQSLRDKQTHDLPLDVVDQSRLCLAMRYPDWASLTAELDVHRAAVAREFERIAIRDSRSDAEQAERRRFSELWTARVSVDAWCEALQESQFSDTKALAEAVIRLRNAPATQKIDTTAAHRLKVLVPQLLLAAKQRKNPVLAVRRSLSVIEKVVRRSAYIALLNENRMAIDRLLSLCESSAYIAQQIGRFPVLLDELLDPRLQLGPVSKKELQAELEAQVSRHEGADSEERMEALAQFQRANLFRIAVVDFGGELPIMKVSDALTFLAETVLEHALAVAWSDLTSKHGVPHFVMDGVSHPAGFGVIAYGKLGGLELSYGSDLDIVFLHDSRGSEQTTDGIRPLDNAVFFGRLVRKLTHFLTTHTQTGALYEVDTRLRPSGRKGLLVTSTTAFERYQQENAWTWEHQALLRARAVAGSEAVAREFERIRQEILTRKVVTKSLRDDVIAMRARMRTELDRSDEAQFDLKQGEGGIGDIEFLVQYLVLANAASHLGVIEFSDNIRQLDALAAAGAVTEDTAGQLQEIYRTYRLQQHHLVLNDEPALISADALLAERRLVVDAWERHFES